MDVIKAIKNSGQEADELLKIKNQGKDSIREDNVHVVLEVGVGMTATLQMKCSQEEDDKPECCKSVSSTSDSTTVSGTDHCDDEDVGVDVGIGVDVDELGEACTSTCKTVIEVVQVSEVSKILVTGKSDQKDKDDSFGMDVDEIGEDAVFYDEHEEQRPGSSSSFKSLSKVKLPTSLVKKSNLRKVSKYESLGLCSPSHSFSFNGSFSSCISSPMTGICRSSTTNTPVGGTAAGDDNPTPRKRIRIIDSNDEKKHSDGERDSSSGDGDFLAQVDLISGHTFMTNIGGEEMIWVSPPPAPLDFSFIHEDIVRAARTPVSKKFSVEIDMHFVDGETINSLLECKPLIISSGFFNFEQACRKNCPIKNAFIYSENASNLQSLDEGLNFDLTFPKELQKDEKENIFYFVDIWVTSKGFREYILSKSLEYLRQGLMMKGFAIQDSDGCRPKDFNTACGLLFSSLPSPDCSKDLELGESLLPIELVDHFHLQNTEDNKKSSDICEISVSDELVKNILAKTNGKGAHLLVADNPECLNVHEFVREVRFQRKLYAQCIIALLAVREGGSFVVKIFDAITLFTAGLIFLMHRCFRSISIHKPQTSPSHTSERFLVCTYKLSCETSDEILQFLLICHNIVMKPEELKRFLRKKARRRLGIQLFEVKQLVPLKVIIGHADFFEFLRLQNIRCTKSLIDKIQQLCSTIPANCSWQLNSPLRKIECASSIHKSGFHQDSKAMEEACISLFKKFGLDSEVTPLAEMDRVLKKELLQEISKSRNDWIVFSIQDCKLVIGAHLSTLFVGLGGTNVFYFNGSKFKPMRVEGLSLTRGTILFGNVAELIPIKMEEGNALDTNSASVIVQFHIMDGISLSGQYIGDFPYSKRMQLCETYATVMNQCREFDYLKCTVIKVAKPIVLKENESVVSSWISSCVYMKKDVHLYPGPLRLTNFFQVDSPLAISVGGLMFYKTSGNVFESMKTRAAWNWTEECERGEELIILPKDFTNLDL